MAKSRTQRLSSVAIVAKWLVDNRIKILKIKKLKDADRVVDFVLAYVDTGGHGSLGRFFYESREIEIQIIDLPHIIKDGTGYYNLPELTGNIVTKINIWIESEGKHISVIIADKFINEKMFVIP